MSEATCGEAVARSRPRISLRSSGLLTSSPPGAKETVSLRIDRDVLDFFQADGPGWQERINAALRKAAGSSSSP